MDAREAAAADEQHWRRIALPMPSRCVPLDYEERFTAEESARLRRCVLPQDMADKWIVLVDDYQLSFHRSWTGFCLYTVVLVNVNEDEEPDRFCACDATANRQPDQYSETDDAFDVALLSWLIRTLLLEQQVELPADPNASPEDALLSAWGFAGNAAFSPPPGDASGPINEPDAEPESGWSPPEIETD